MPIIYLFCQWRLRLLSAHRWWDPWDPVRKGWGGPTERSGWIAMCVFHGLMPWEWLNIAYPLALSYCDQGWQERRGEEGKQYSCAFFSLCLHVPSMLGCSSSLFSSSCECVWSIWSSTVFRQMADSNSRKMDCSWKSSRLMLDSQERQAVGSE